MEKPKFFFVYAKTFSESKRSTPFNLLYFPVKQNILCHTDIKINFFLYFSRYQMFSEVSVAETPRNIKDLSQNFRAL